MDDIASMNNTIVTDQPPVICLIGTLRANDLTHKNLVEKVIKPLNADLIFCVTRVSAEDETFVDNFRDCNIVDVCIYEDGKDGYEDLLEKFSSKLTPENQNQWRKYFNIEGNWLGGMQGRRGSGFHLTFNYWKLLQRLQHLRTKGFDYQRFVISRTDLFWMVEHPPLNLLDPKFVWIPTGENYNGYNDRHAVCSNQNISYYLNMFEFMMNLRALEYVYNEIDGNNLNHERYLKSHLDYCGVEVATFKNVAYLTGSKETLTNWASVKSQTIDGKEYAYKYEEELLSSLAHLKEFETHKDWNKLISRKKKY